MFPRRDLTAEQADDAGQRPAAARRPVSTVSMPPPTPTAG